MGHAVSLALLSPKYGLSTIFRESLFLMNHCLSTECRRVRQALRAWKTSLPDIGELIPTGAVAPVGEPVVLKPLEEIEILRRTCIRGEIMVLVCCRDRLYLITEDELETGTVHEPRLSSPP
jgi:hypothetical protein